MYLISGVVFLLAMGVYCYSRVSVGKAESGFPPAGKFVKVNGIRLHYMDRGEGRPVVFLHGGVLRGTDFDKVLELGISKGFRVLAFDRPGYGYSERPKRKKNTPTPFVQADLLQLALKEIGVESPILVGHSWSGLLALIYASRYPDQLSGVMTVAGGMYKEGYPAEKADPVSKLVTTPIAGRLVMNMLLPTLGRMMADRVLKATFAPEQVPSGFRKETLALWLRPSQFKANREDVIDFVPAAERMENQIPHISVPAAILVGMQDPFPTKEHSYRLHSELPHSVLIELPGAAHMIPQNHPESVVDAVETLVDSFLHEKWYDKQVCMKERPEERKIT